MRKTFVTFALACAVGAGAIADTGCNSAWWQNFKNDPVEQVQTFEATIQVAVSAAELAWPAIVQAIPPASQAQANLQFQNAVTAVNHGLQALNDAVNAAVAAQQPNPDFSALMQAISDAVNQVIAIVDLYSQQPAAPDAGPPPPPPASDAGPAPAPSVAMKAAPLSATTRGNIADLHSAYNSLTRWGVKIKTH